MRTQRETIFVGLAEFFPLDDHALHQMFGASMYGALKTLTWSDPRQESIRKQSSVALPYEAWKGAHVPGAGGGQAKEHRAQLDARFAGGRPLKSFACSRRCALRADSRKKILPISRR